MILVIRISGIPGIPHTVEDSLFRMRLRRKYAAVVVPPTKDNLHRIAHLRNFVAYGEIDKATLTELIEKRGEAIDKKKKLDGAKIAEALSTKTPEELNLKPFFRLHPPRGGIDSKNHVGTSRQAVLGDNKEKINQLVRRML